MPRKIWAGPSTLLHSARPELGCALEEDRRRARAADRSRYASVHRAGDERRHNDGGQKVRKGKQPAGRGVQPSRSKKLHNLPRREQPLWMGDEPAFAKEWVSLEASNADKRRDNKERAECEERLDIGG